MGTQETIILAGDTVLVRDVVGSTRGERGGARQYQAHWVHFLPRKTVFKNLPCGKWNMG